MTDAAIQNPVAQPAAPSGSEAATMSQLNATIGRLSDVMEKKEAEERKATQQMSHRFSRGTITLALAMAGMKMTGLLGAKIGILYSFITDKRGPLSLDLSKEAERGWRFLRQSGTGAAIAGFIGAAVFGAFGWARSNRIKDPDDLVHKPFASLARLFGSQPPEDTPAPESPPPATAPAASLPDKHWQAQEMAKKAANEQQKRTLV